MQVKRLTGCAHVIVDTMEAAIIEHLEPLVSEDDNVSVQSSSASASSPTSASPTMSEGSQYSTESESEYVSTLRGQPHDVGTHDWCAACLYLLYKTVGETSKIGDVVNLLRRWEGHEQELLDNAASKYTQHHTFAEFRHEVQKPFREELQRIYTTCEASRKDIEEKLSRVDALLAKYVGDEHDLISQARIKYGHDAPGKCTSNEGTREVIIEDEGKLSMVLSARTSHRVKSVVEGGLAHLAGVQTDSELLRVGDQSVFSMSHNECIKLLFL